MSEFILGCYHVTVYGNSNRVSFRFISRLWTDIRPRWMHNHCLSMRRFTMTTSSSHLFNPSGKGAFSKLFAVRVASTVLPPSDRSTQIVVHKCGDLYVRISNDKEATC